MEPRLTLVTLGVADFDRSLHFYREGLGWPAETVVDGVVAFFVLGGTRLALHPRTMLADDAGVSTGGEGVPVFPGFSLAHNVRTREEVDRVLEEVQPIGGTVRRPAHDTDWGGYAGYFADPDGFLWEVAWNPAWRID